VAEISHQRQGASCSPPVPPSWRVAVIGLVPHRSRSPTVPWSRSSASYLIRSRPPT